MYLPAHFDESRPAVLRALALAHPLATLVCQGADGLLANHIPMLVNEDFSIARGHIARANPLWRVIGAGLPALAIFHGADGYVSPALYPGKAVDGRVVPTWNYAVVHAHGELRAVDDAVWVRAVVDDLTALHEAAREHPWRLDDAPADYAKRMVAAVVGIELRVATVRGKFKLSQNRNAADRAAVQAEFSDGELGALMANRLVEDAPN